MDYKQKLIEWEAKRLEIYKKSQEDHMSYSQLAREYNVTATRICHVIRQVKTKLAKSQ